MGKESKTPKQIEIMGYRIPIITLVGGVLTLLYLFITTASSGFLSGLGSVGAIALVTSLYSLIRNKPSWAMIPNKNVAGMVLAGSVILMFIASGAGITSTPNEKTPVVVEEITETPSQTPTITPSKTEPTRTPSPSPTPTPTAAPLEEAPPAQAPVEQPVQAPVEPAFSYENCTAVRAAGAAPIYAGDYGYSRKLDRDGDGVACE